MNKISNLLKKPFSTYSLEEKLEIKRLGRPLPDLEISKTCAASASGNSKARTRKFNRNIYSKNGWLCGCDEKHAFFCFPCTLFGGENTWTKYGVTDLVHIWEKIKTHEKSRVHINNVFSFSVLGKSNISTQLSAAYRQTILAHNEQVDKNRYVLNIIINCIRFCGALELALRGHDESDDSENRGVFRELIDFSSHLDKDLRHHFSKSSVFKGTSKTTQNELLECMLDIYHQEVEKEIKSADYVGVIADETTDVASEFQLVIILRYIVGGKPVERFWNFVNPAGHDAISISECILKEINPLVSDTPNKLIAQSYDGASVMSGGLNGVQKIIKDKYPFANYIHCYAHQVNLIMSSAASSNRSVRIFFAHLSGICSFFSTSPQRTQVLDEIVQRRLPRSSQTRWNFHSRGVNTVYEYRKELIVVMETLENHENIKLDSTIEQAGAYKLRLKDKDFVFWLTVFHKVMPHVEIVFKQLQKKNTDPVRVKQDLKIFENEIQKIRDQMDTIIEDIDLEDLEDEPPPHKRSRTQSTSDSLINKKREALEICDCIIQQINTRFSFSGHLVATNLFAVDNFPEYRDRFPDKFLCEVVDVYPFLEKSRLKTELQVLYEREELRSVSGAVSLLSLVTQEEMCDTFQETLKLLKVLVTVPMSTSEAERCFSMLKRIKTFLRNSMKEERLSALGMLSAEKAFLNNIEDFNKRVIDLFANKKERRMDFTYRAV